jgi:hypothetical protein
VRLAGACIGTGLWLTPPHPPKKRRNAAVKESARKFKSLKLLKRLFTINSCVAERPRSGCVRLAVRKIGLIFKLVHSSFDSLFARSAKLHN